MPGKVYLGSLLKVPTYLSVALYPNALVIIVVTHGAS
jgi:hypothetical protein